MNKRFLFFKNFKHIADNLPDDMRLKFYDGLLAYVFDGIEPEDAYIAALITAIKPSLDKEDKRGGNHNPTGLNQYSEVKTGQKEVKNNFERVKSGQSGQSFLETGNRKQETGKKEKDTLKGIEKEKTEVFSPHKKLVPLDWLPKEATIAKLNEKGFDADKVVEKFINSCHAKNLKYIDFDRAVLAWDWSRDSSVKAEEECWL